MAAVTPPTANDTNVLSGMWSSSLDWAREGTKDSGSTFDLVVLALLGAAAVGAFVIFMALRMKTAEVSAEVQKMRDDDAEDPAAPPPTASTPAIWPKPDSVEDEVLKALAKTINGKVVGDAVYYCTGELCTLLGDLTGSQVAVELTDVGKTRAMQAAGAAALAAAKEFGADVHAQNNAVLAATWATFRNGANPLAAAAAGQAAAAAIMSGSIPAASQALGLAASAAVVKSLNTGNTSRGNLSTSAVLEGQRVIEGIVYEAAKAKALALAPPVSAPHAAIAGNAAKFEIVSGRGALSAMIAGEAAAAALARGVPVDMALAAGRRAGEAVAQSLKAGATADVAARLGLATP
jgi:hypothetical protein